MDWVQLDWKGPYALERARTASLDGAFGLYAITAMSGGKRQLLYVGTTYWKTFAKKLGQHEREWLHHVEGNVAIYFAHVSLSQGRRMSYVRAKDVEKLLIHKCFPPYNTASEHVYTGRDLLVINTGKAVGIDKAISNDYDLLRLIAAKAR